MPTGYTAGILDGTIKDFPQFAKTCMRAFGATIMMRDEPLDKEWEPEQPSDYHVKALQEVKANLSIAKESPDEVIVSIRHNELVKSKEYHKKAIVETKRNKLKLEMMLEESKNFNPPTEDHTGIKDFMIDQIKQTIDFDCKTEYNRNELAKIESELLDLNASEIRKEMIAKAEKDIQYHEKHLQEDIDRANNRNRWVEQFLKAINKTQL